MTIKIEDYKIGDSGPGVSISDNNPHHRAELHLSGAEALQVRDELNRRYPLGVDQIAPMLEKLGVVYVTVQANEGRRVERCVINHGLTVAYIASGSKPTPAPVEEKKPRLSFDAEHLKTVLDGLEASRKASSAWNKMVDAIGATGLKMPIAGGDYGAFVGSLSGGTIKVEGCSAVNSPTTFASPNAPLAVGDTVRLKSGGPVMTVARVSEENVRCEWFKGSESRWDVFKVAALVRAKP